MTTKTKTTPMKNLWKDNATKLLWIAIPLFISLMVWIVVMIYDTNTGVQVVRTENVEQGKTIDKIWTQVQVNNTILRDKADQETNEREHQAILTRIGKLEDKVDRNYKTFTFNERFMIYPYLKDTSFLWTNNNLTYDSKTGH